MAIYKSDEERIAAIAYLLPLGTTERYAMDNSIFDIIREIEDERKLTDFLVEKKVEILASKKHFDSDPINLLDYHYRDRGQYKKLSDEDILYSLEAVKKILNPTNVEDPHIRTFIRNSIILIQDDRTKKEQVEKFSSINGYNFVGSDFNIAASYKSETYKIGYLKRMSDLKLVNAETISGLEYLLPTIVGGSAEKIELLESAPQELKIRLVPYTSISDDKKELYINLEMEKATRVREERKKNGFSREFLYSALATGAISSLENETAKIRYLNEIEKLRREEMEEVQKANFQVRKEERVKINKLYIGAQLEVIKSIKSIDLMRSIYMSHCKNLGEEACRDFFDCQGQEVYSFIAKHFEEKVLPSVLEDRKEKEQQMQEPEKAAKMSVEYRNQNTYLGREVPLKREIEKTEPSVDEIIADMKKRMPIPVEQEKLLRERIAAERTRQYEQKKQLIEARRKAIIESTRMATERSMAISSEVEERQYKTDEMIFNLGSQAREDVTKGEETTAIAKEIEGYGVPLTEEQLEQLKQARINKEYYDFKYERVPEIDARRNKELLSSDYFGMDPGIREEMAQYWEAESKGPRK